MSAPHTPESFWANVKKQPSGCWEWQGCTNVPNGYGLVRWDRKQRVTHRVAAFISGMIVDVKAPPNKQDKTHVLHTCDNKLCCNPDHLYLGSYSDNLRHAYKTGLKKPACGEHANSKLTALKVRQIFTKRRQGQPRASVANQFGISKAMVDKIAQGNAWKHITKEFLA
ncbi:HNH endonuclease [Rhodoferax fermentans]|uniref:Zinc-binding loop region of homing endonuclease domain-containing protein n=1 Tax=Rhodoferax fermentans TaxID=28066 RepID=A0A1T1AP42_RHOFE|nr:HNH endonuclease [Rhodoferax fermentans]OOV05797.1 hypothetical protein RF819_02900 [Rhodoferax fermentans]